MFENKIILVKWVHIQVGKAVIRIFINQCDVIKNKAMLVKSLLIPGSKNIV